MNAARRVLRSRLAATAVLAGLLATLSILAPLVNAGSGPPRMLFLQLPPDLPEPRLALAARQDRDDSWRLEIDAEGFRFTDACLASADAVPVGHAHVLRGETKVASATTPVVALGRLEPGAHHFRVMLRGQDHRALVGRRGLIQADVAIEVPPAG